MRTEDPIIQPLLRIRDVAARGALYGLAAVPLLGVASLFVGDHNDRRTFLGVVGLLAAFLVGVGILLGLFFWWACRPDIRRCRDWHTVTGQGGPITVAAPVLLRVGVSALVLLPGAFGLHFLVEGAEYGSWLYGR
ncbi:hypothetical protein ADK65_08510 [Streptomyces sp. NRRL B-1140]|uniref:DUF6336 family protein n=1 Tax=Streptomyces sp. NRRL B-1140 TaxID=1415549 RepID=UPI0006B068EF|nr:DUF6336 family protein [Streptomyces sp. NRRL B-1140]KOX02216.1 hypothetical protein ADK65_08510 [Streptomyces sp. NRRL B-1140]